MQVNQQSPEGAEIKIPGVGSTPIAISTQLPAAVAQLSKKGELLYYVYFFSVNCHVMRLTKFICGHLISYIHYYTCKT